MTLLIPLDEPGFVIQRYSRRLLLSSDPRYSPLNPSVLYSWQERERALLQFFSKYLKNSLADTCLLEIGCGEGRNLQELLMCGFEAQNLMANELLPDRSAHARRSLPASIKVYEGDALMMNIDESSFDIVYQSTVFSSLLDSCFQERLARKMWDWVRPGGAVLWYDFTCDNPSNPDVRGVPIGRIRQLFPNAVIDIQRVTLAPPISRRVTRLHPSLYSAFNLFPFLRTHLLCWIQKI